MAEKFHTFSVSPPEEFVFTASEWPKWLVRFDRFRVVSELNSRDQGYQVETLLYMMGPQSEDLIKSLSLSASDMKVYKTVCDKITKFYEPRHNIIFQRAKFNTRVQQHNEPIENFISDLHSLADKCDYADLKEQLIRDRLIVGMSNKKLSEKLQMKEDLTLQKAVDEVVQSEMVHQQQKLLRNGAPSTSKGSGDVNHLYGKKQYGKSQKPKSGKQSKQGGKSADGQDHQVLKSPCRKCGNSVHYVRNQCPADNATCFRCKERVTTQLNLISLVVN